MFIKKGEVRKVGVEISSRLNQSFIIESADYVVKTAEGEETDRGYPTIDGHKIVMLYSAIAGGSYFCEFTYRIGPEILKSKIDIEVI